ncbi:MAG: ribose 5-phosphate isomerase B [Bacteroidales bacterium]|nr:ribose 5-phosphate isomerase B [Bacteroidales bacterium]MCB8999784.1 ribose 5-phosphate isomerase B [Bacteroidales bacterium]
MEKEKIAIAADHAGYELKQMIISHLQGRNFDIKDFGTNSPQAVDYADYAHPLANAIESGEFPRGISICGSGNGINMTVNKHPGIRSALCWNVEIARLARFHNDANICALPARFITREEAFEIIDMFLSTGFEGGRHQQRISKIPIKK